MRRTAKLFATGVALAGMVAAVAAAGADARGWASAAGGRTPEAPRAASVPAPEPLTLAEAVRLTLENNRDIMKAVEMRESLLGRYVEERASALPQVTASASTAKSWDETMSMSSSPRDASATDLALSVSQPLFTWGQVTAAIRAAKTGLGTADDQLRVYRQAAVRDVTAAFHDVVLAKELRDVAVQARGQKGRHLDEAKKKYAAGTATDYDVLSAEVGLKNVEPDVIRAGNRILQARERLRFLLGRGAKAVDADGTLDGVCVPEPVPYEKALAVALSRRPELSDLDRRRLVAEDVVTIAKAGDKPRVDLRGGFGWKEVEAGAFSADGSNWSVGVFASWPLFDGEMTRGKVAQAKSDARTLDIDRAKAADAIALEVQIAVDAVREGADIVAAVEGTVAEAKSLLSMAEKGYEFGVKTKLDVDDAWLGLAQARVSLARARRDYLVARTNLEHAMGTLAEGEAPPVPPKDAFVPASDGLGIAREILDGTPVLGR